MFTHILLPTDGSELSLRAVDIGIELAARYGAQVHAIHVLHPFQGVVQTMHAAPLAIEAEDGSAATRAGQLLAEVQRRAEAAGVACDGKYVSDPRPYVAIVSAARQWHCDLIVMGSHGRSGLARLLAGSETQKVTTNCSVPVLVCH
ncbi:universal stress protein [Dokdonella ginsengisoli]|uniref:Universal stress protein n=1 Tax=Dokdonella ginsengisoli TaxID=363846 RepID=A0ABV9QQ04_9GAMM